jgi:hypothetical protein
VIEEGAFRFFRAAYEAVVTGVVCAKGGGEGVVCGWWGEEGGETKSTREERRRVRCERGREVYNKSDQDLFDWDEEAAVEQKAVRMRNTTRVQNIEIQAKEKRVNMRAVPQRSSVKKPWITERAEWRDFSLVTASIYLPLPFLQDYWTTGGALRLAS